MTTLPHSLTRTVEIRAPRELVFRYFTDAVRWASWWGAGSTIDARVGGGVTIRYPGNVEVSGEVVELVPPDRIVFTYGYASGAPFGPGGSLVTIRLAAIPTGTRLHLEHEFAEAAARDQHVQGWRYQLALFGNVVSDEVNADAALAVDGWFDAWAEADAGKMERDLARIALPTVRFRDRYGLVDGMSDLLPHIAAAQRFMPGVRLRRDGEIRHCQGTVLADWTAFGPDGKELGRGTNVYTFGSDGRIDAVTGIWGRPKAD